MSTENTLKFGFIKDENNLKLKEVFEDGAVLKDIYIDIYSKDPISDSSSAFMLLLRASGKKIIVENNEDRLVLKKNDSFNTCLMSILFSEIKSCYCEILDTCSEFVISIQNIYYRITVFN